MKSLVKNGDELSIVDIEISFLPGLPQIHFLGLPDQIIKESLFRIKTAFRACGFDFPKTHQTVVNIRPNHLKKSSRGLELAVALGVLQATSQVSLPEDISNWIVYGELTLDGDVIAPDDIFIGCEWYETSMQVLTGVCHKRPSVPLLNILRLDKWREISRAENMKLKSDIVRPQINDQIRVSKSQARLLEILAWGGHSALLAGPAGAGKSTLTKNLHSLLPPPTSEEWAEIQKNYFYSAEDLECAWRPIIQPHHTSTPLSMVGGGVPPKKGEVSRAHRGLLVLDEFLEFNTRVQESLREPMEEGKVRIARGPQSKEFSARTQVVATTNLCPCGDWVPQQKNRCQRSATKCRSYREKLSGPILDRFQILYFCHKTSATELTVSLRQVLDLIEKRDSNQEMGANAFATEASILRRLDSNTKLEYFPWEQGSHRRRLATLRVALSLAELNLRETIQMQDIEEAFRWTWLPHLSLKSEEQLTWR